MINFAKNPFNPNEPLKMDLLLSFTLFDENGKTTVKNEKGEI